MTFVGAGWGWGTAESATAPCARADRAFIVSTKILSFKEEEAHCPAPHPALVYKGWKGAQHMPTLTLSPRIQPEGRRDILSLKLKHKPLEGALSSASQSEAGTVRELSSAGKKPRRMRNPLRMGIERAETPRRSHPKPGIGAPRPPALHSHPFWGARSPSPGNEPSHTEEMELYFHKYWGNTHSKVAKRGAGASN